MEPTWIELAGIYKDYNKIIIAEMDCTKYGEICHRHEVTGYPSLIMFDYGQKVEKYSGPRNLESFSIFVKNHLKKYHDEL